MVIVYNIFYVHIKKKKQKVIEASNFVHHQAN